MPVNRRQSAHRQFYSLPASGPPGRPNQAAQEDQQQLISYINESVIGTIWEAWTASLQISESFLVIKKSGLF
jgi:hypothetical protein